MPSLRVSSPLLAVYLFWAADDPPSGSSALLLRQYPYGTGSDCFDGTPTPAVTPLLNAWPAPATESLAAGQPASHTCPHLHLLIL